VLGRQGCWRRGSDDDIHFHPNELSRQPRELIGLPLRETDLDGYISALNPAVIAQPRAGSIARRVTHWSSWRGRPPSSLTRTAGEFVRQTRRGTRPSKLTPSIRTSIAAACDELLAPSAPRPFGGSAMRDPTARDRGDREDCVAEKTLRVNRVDAYVERVLAWAGCDLRVAAPLGLGKPNVLLNALYRRAAAEPGLTLHLYTALSLTRPAAGSDLDRRFLEMELVRSRVPDVARDSEQSCSVYAEPALSALLFVYRHVLGVECPGRRPGTR
jgi:hypothetical protein